MKGQVESIAVRRRCHDRPWAERVERNVVNDGMPVAEVIPDDMNRAASGTVGKVLVFATARNAEVERKEAVLALDYGWHCNSLVRMQLVGERCGSAVPRERPTTSTISTRRLTCIVWFVESLSILINGPKTICAKRRNNRCDKFRDHPEPNAVDQSHRCNPVTKVTQEVTVMVKVLRPDNCS